MRERKPTIRTLDKDHCVATWDRLLIQIWRFGTSSQAVTNLGRVARKFISEEQASICSLAIVEPTSLPPSDAVRAELSNFYRGIAPNVNAALVVAEGGGFRGAIVRGVGLTLSALAPRSLPFQFASSVREATSIIGPHLSREAGGASALQQVLEEFRVEIVRNSVA